MEPEIISKLLSGHGIVAVHKHSVMGKEYYDLSGMSVDQRVIRICCCSLRMLFHHSG